MIHIKQQAKAFQGVCFYMFVNREMSLLMYLCVYGVMWSWTDWTSFCFSPLSLPSEVGTGSQACREIQRPGQRHAGKFNALANDGLKK